MSFAKDGDISSAQMAVLSTLLKTNFLGDIMMNLTLNIMQTPVKEFMEEGRQESILEINYMKFYGINKFKEWYNFNRNRTFFAREYDFKSISYNSMQGLLNGKIKNWRDLEYAYNEVTIFYKYITDQDIFIIDTFFIKEI